MTHVEPPLIRRTEPDSGCWSHILLISVLFEGLRRLWAKTFEQSELPALRQLLKRALAHCSLCFPVSQHDLIVHLLHHVVDSVTLFGPPWAIAM